MSALGMGETVDVSGSLPPKLRGDGEAFRALRIIVCGLVVCAGALGAQEPAPPLVDPKAPAADNSAEITTIKKDIGEIKDDMKVLQETLDLIVNRMMADLEKENAQLREEVRRLQEAGPSSAPAEAAGFVPRPGAALFEEVAQEDPAAAPPPEPAAPVEFTWENVAEWGRDPEAAAKVGANSLKGMVIVVPPGSARTDVEDLARALRSEFGNYDNINIEIFDDLESAQSYASSQVADPRHRILSVSKHKASGRDKILYLGGKEEAQELDKPGDAQAAEAAAPPSPEAGPAPEPQPAPEAPKDTAAPKGRKGKGKEEAPPPLEAAKP